ncbi:MAG: AAA family ATPase [Burkholderiales bacterium]|nr:AAA family ATPase [Burkholderiales bacterium]
MARAQPAARASSPRARRTAPRSGAGSRPGAGDAALVARLLDPACYPHPVSGVRVVETHISWVLLTGNYAYKIKKPVNLGFVDFTSPEMRRYYCEAELRLNRRLAPDLYLEVVEIRGDERSARIGGAGPVIEHAVRMREFPQSDLASRALARGAFGAAEIDCLASAIARFHARAPAAAGGDRLGSPETVLAAAMQNFTQIGARALGPGPRRALDALRGWTERECAALRETLAARKRAGFVRECHGDLHLGNIALIDGKPVPFDCIEFNDELRWIDVMSEVAFLFMDLEDRGRGDLAWRFLNRYLEASGDYEGLRALPFYAAYRALVRAKVHLLRARQPRIAAAERARLTAAFEGYVALARRLAQPARPAIAITHGLSGCGKTTATQTLTDVLGAVRVRSDLERKRLHGLAPLAASGSAPGAGIYTREANAATYRRLGELAQHALAAGYPVVVDATFLLRTEREAFRALAEKFDAPYVILDFHAPLEVLRARVAARRVRANDASEADLAVLDRQVAAREPLTPSEMEAAVTLRTTKLPSGEMWRPVLARLRPRPVRERRPVPAPLGRRAAARPGRPPRKRVAKARGTGRTPSRRARPAP